MLNVAGSAREHILNVQLCAVALQHGLNRHWRALLWCHPHAFCRSELVHCRGGSGRQARDIKTEHMLDPALLYPYTVYRSGGSSSSVQSKRSVRPGYVRDG
eukprot:6375092-Prymnesium_polylepis.4